MSFSQLLDWKLAEFSVPCITYVSFSVCYCLSFWHCSHMCCACVIKTNCIKNAKKNCQRLETHRMWEGSEMKSTLDVSPSPSPGRPTASSEQQNNHRHKTPPLAQCCCWLASLSIHCSVKYVLAPAESLCLFHVAYSWSLCANMMSSLKPEVHNVSLCCQSRTEPLL